MNQFLVGGLAYIVFLKSLDGLVRVASFPRSGNPGSFLGPRFRGDDDQGNPASANCKVHVVTAVDP